MHSILVTLNKQWEVTGGVRFDSFTTDYHNELRRPKRLNYDK